MLKIKLTWKRVLLSLLFLLLFFLAYYVGGVVGYSQGSTSVSYLSDSEAYSTSLALQKLRNEDYSRAIDLLEARLDTEILHCGASENSHKSLYNLYWLVFRQAQEDSHNSLLLPVAEYRSKYPSTSMFPEVQQQVKDILKNVSNKTGE